MNAPEITVLLTVFNGGKFLGPAVESILCQSREDFEFVIVDDASTDGSAGILNQLAARDRRIRLFFNKENSGQTACLNQGLREARGRWIARQDADDLSLPGRLAAQMSHAARFPDLVLVGVNGWVIDERGTRTGLIHVPLSDAGIRWSMPFQNPFIHPGVIFRRVMPRGDRVAYCEDFRICQDWELWSRIADEGRVSNLPDRLVCYRDRRDSLSHNYSEDTRRECRAVSAAAWRKNFPGEPLSEEAAMLLER
ncbi:MAG: glycosyltransferase, partial [Verrucomicrobiota bacterium]